MKENKDFFFLESRPSFKEWQVLQIGNKTQYFIIILVSRWKEQQKEEQIVYKIDYPLLHQFCKSHLKTETSHNTI
jgi:hypothetical protein